MICLLGERAAGVEKTFFYSAFALRLYEPTSLMMFSEQNGQLTPLAAALAVAISQVEGLQPTGIDHPAAGATALSFATGDSAEGPKRSVWAIWTVRGTSRVSLPAPADKHVTAIGFFGRAVEFERSGERVSLEAGPLPTYVCAE